MVRNQAFDWFYRRGRLGSTAKLEVSALSRHRFVYFYTQTVRTNKVVHPTTAAPIKMRVSSLRMQKITDVKTLIRALIEHPPPETYESLSVSKPLGELARRSCS